MSCAIILLVGVWRLWKNAGAQPKMISEVVSQFPNPLSRTQTRKNFLILVPFISCCYEGHFYFEGIDQKSVNSVSLSRHFLRRAITKVFSSFLRLRFTPNARTSLDKGSVCCTIARVLFTLWRFYELEEFRRLLQKRLVARQCWAISRSKNLTRLMMKHSKAWSRTSSQWLRM